MEPDINQVDRALAVLNLGSVASMAAMPGGNSPVFRIDFRDGASVVLKVYADARISTPERDAFAASLLAETTIPATRYLLVDDSLQKLPFCFAVTNYLPGVTLAQLKDHPDIASAYRQAGGLLRSLHTIEMPGYGRFGPHGMLAPVASHEDYIRARLASTFDNFATWGAEAGLMDRLRRIADERFDAIIPHSAGAVFAHDDLHPNNVLAVEDGKGHLVLSGLIDFGNAHAADPIWDLAKCLFCSEHDAPGSTVHLRAGYGEIAHPDPEGALWYYTMLHRMTMWSWLRQMGAIPNADTASELIDDLRRMADA
jgi:Ser/Thr protein kinase RdoA (MazF antagonist)